MIERLDVIGKVPPIFQHFVESIWNAPADGHCGFHCVAKGLSIENPIKVLADCLKYVCTNKKFLETIWAGKDAVDKVQRSLQPMANCSALKSTELWFSKLDHGPLVANVYQRPVAFIGPEDQSHTCFPNSVPSPSTSNSNPPIYLLFTRGCHWELILVPQDKKVVIPLPPALPGWTSQNQTSADV